MSLPRLFDRLTSQAGASLVELMMALVILAIGLLSIGQLFPAGARTQTQDRMATTAANYAQEELERLGTVDWADPDLTNGRHPAGTATVSLGTGGKWQRFYVIEQMANPLPSLKKATVTVTWVAQQGSRSVTATTYLRR